LIGAVPLESRRTSSILKNDTDEIKNRGRIIEGKGKY
jgi:hypothetical protein